MKRNVTKEIKSIARERVGRVKAGKVIVPKVENTIKTRACNNCAGYGLVEPKPCRGFTQDCPRCGGDGNDPR